MKNIERPLYLNRIKPFIGKSIIKVLTGQRRVGKSYILLQLMDFIKKQNPKTQIIYINKELQEFSHIRNSTDLFNHLKENIENKKGEVSLFIDEIQDIDSFEITLRDLIARGNYDIYCTGSNAKLLSGELATYLSGRYIEVKIFGLSYSEYLKFYNETNSVSTFNKYLKFGGLPYLINLESDIEIAYEYLINIYNTIILKDVVTRYKIRNVKFLENLLLFLADNLGNIVSSKKKRNILNCKE